ncbi:hypothetical protein D918_03043, partial [Trichuris suis]
EPQPSDPNKDVSPPGDDGSKNSTVPPGDDGPKNSTAPPGNDGPKNATVPPGDDGSKNSTLPPGGQPESSNSSKDNVPVENVRVNIVLYKDNALGRTIMAFEGLDNTFPANSALEPTRYTRTGPIGSIVKNGSSVPGCKELKPVHQLYSAVTGETAYVANQKHIDNLVNELGFKDKGIIGQTVSGLKECNATKVVITCYGVNGFEIRVTNTTNSTTIWKQLFPKYRYVRTNFIAWEPEGSSFEVPSEPNVNPYKFNPPLISGSDGSLVPFPGFT